MLTQVEGETNPSSNHPEDCILTPPDSPNSNALVEQPAYLAELLSTPELREKYLEVLRRIENGETVYLSELAAIQERYPQGLLNNLPEDPEKLADLLSYIANRVPTQLFSDRLVKIELSNDSNAIMQVPHAADTSPGEAFRKKAPARNRWYLKIPKGSTLKLVFGIRDIDLESPTDALEILTWLGSLEQIRRTTMKLEERGVDTSPIQKAIQSMYQKHITAEQEMLQRKLMIEENEASRQQMNNRLEVLGEKQSNLAGRANELYQGWVHRPHEVDTPISSSEAHGDYKLDRRKDPSNAAKETLRLVSERLDVAGIGRPTDVLFANDFSLRLLLSTALFDDSEYAVLDNYFLGDSSLEQIQEVVVALDKISDSDLRETARRFLLVQQLSFASAASPEIQTLRSRLFDLRTFESIGIKRVVGTSESPLAEPIDVIVPEQISDELYAKMTKPIKELVDEITQNQQVILSVPYTLGHLTVQVLDAMRRLWPGSLNIGFLGKVGSPSTGQEPTKVGDFVLPQMVKDQLGNPALAVPNTLEQAEVAEMGHPTWVAKMALTTLALTAQEAKEMAALYGLDPKEIFMLEMELRFMIAWYYALPEDEQVHYSLTLLYYISDKTAVLDAYNQAFHDQDKISKPLGLRGAIPVCLGSLMVLKKLAQRNQSRGS